MLTPQQNTPIQAAIGQYVTVKQSFTSDVMLTGDVLKFHPQLYADGTTPLNPSYQIIYPPAAGVYDFTNISGSNYKAKLKVVTATSFEIQFSFFVVKQNSLSNAGAFNNTSFTDNVGIYVKHDNSHETALMPIDVQGFCTDSVEFIESGFIPGNDLIVNFKVQGTTNNNFFVGIFKEDAISNGPISPNLVSNYAKVSSGSSQVDDLPFNCISDGFGFQENSGESLGGITILGSCLHANSSYKVYVVYFKDGQWKSCLSNSIVATATNSPIVPKGTFMAMDEFGNEGEQCINGLSPDIEIDLCFELDIADFDTQLAANGLSGTWSDYFVSAKAFSSNNASSYSGAPLTLSGTEPTFCVYGFKPETDGKTFVIIQLRFDYPTHSDFINVPFDLTYNAVEIPLNITVNGGVGELCDGETYTIDQTIDNDCEIFQSVNGSTWVPNTIITGQNVNVGVIPNYGIACFKVICSDGADVPSECECDECVEVTATIELLSDNNGIYINVTSDSDAINTLVEGSLFNPTGTPITSSLPYNLESFGLCQSASIDKIYLEKPNGCKYEWQGYEEIIQGCVIPIDSQVIIKNVVLSRLTIYQDCDCPEPNTNECKNYASINFDCNEETGDITINFNENLASPTSEIKKLCSTDGGLTFIPCPAVIMGASSVFITYDATFTDGCAPLHVEQTIQCAIIAPCQNNRTIELANNSNTLVITLTDTFDSGVLTDKLYVSLDNGANYTQYNPASSYTPITLAGNEKIVVYTDTIFDDGCNDLTVTKKLDLESGTTNPPGECAGYAGYTLTSAYDENTGQFIVTKTGNEANLVVNQLLWTIGGANPFDENKSGIPYYGVVTGEGVFIARWKIKLPNCPELILDAMAWGKKCCETEVPEIIVNVEAPQVTVNVDACCDEEPCPDLTLTITCVNKTLTISGSPVGSTISWTGPNGFTATGNNVMFPSNTPSGLFTATVVDGDCTYTATYNYTKPNAGTPIANPILIQP